MRSTTSPAIPRIRRPAVVGRAARVLGTLTLVVTAGCGGDGGGASDVSLPAAAANGRSLANAAGCTSCHGPDFQGGVAPTWIGLAGSQVELADGSTVIADTAYLTRSIQDPSAQKVRGNSVAMPPNALSADEVADVVAFIEALADTAP
jgi:cytochrome c553